MSPSISLYKGLCWINQTLHINEKCNNPPSCAKFLSSRADFLAREPETLSTDLEKHNPYWNGLYSDFSSL